MRLGDSAAPAQQAAFFGLTNAMQGVRDSLPARESGMLPTAAQVTCNTLSLLANTQQGGLQPRTQ